MMKIMNVQEEILLWSKNVKGCLTANISLYWRSLIKFQELLTQKLDRSLFRITENDTFDESFLTKLQKMKSHVDLNTAIWKKVAEAISITDLIFHKWPHGRLTYNKDRNACWKFWKQPLRGPRSCFVGVVWNVFFLWLLRGNNITCDPLSFVLAQYPNRCCKSSRCRPFHA